ncbi:hypothetical protein GCM10027416_31230 [Okibacterium endophyticum]
MTALPTAQPRRPRTGAIATLIIGAILTITGPIFGVLAGSFAMVPGALGIADDTAEVSPTGTVTLDAGESVYLLVPVASLENVSHESCTATGPEGAVTTVAFAPASALNTLVSGSRYESFALVTATERGPQSITCATENTPVVAAPPFMVEALLGPLAWWSIGGLAVSIVGVVMVIIGIVGIARKDKPASADA